MMLTFLFVGVCSWQSAWADDVVANVTMKETNSLSSEILALSGIDDVKTVTKLTVTTNEGVKLGDEDWTTLSSMAALVDLDLSNASADAVPEREFYDHCPNLANVKLPKDLKTIGEFAFGSKENLVTVEVPSTVTSIGWSAFGHCSKLITCDISSCLLTTIPGGCFINCTLLNSFTIPSTVTEIGSDAFRDCSNFTSLLPANLKKIGSNAFAYADMVNVDVVLNENVDVDYNAFSNSNIKSITLPTTYYEHKDLFSGCSNLTTVTFKSPTLVSGSYAVSNASDITLVVPSHLIAAYKSDNNWSKYKDVVAISPAVTEYTVNTDLKLSNSSIRMEGSPSLYFNEGISFGIYGNAAQAFTNFTSSSDISGAWPSNYKCSMIFNENADVTISGDYKQRFYTDQSYWKFLCLPFDFVVEDVTADNGSFVIRTYDGNSRNTNNSDTGNWSDNMDASTEIKAGTGFILRTSENTWVTFKAKTGGTNNAFKKQSDELKTPLAANNSNTSASAANTGWNMVGNPWPTYYNIHKLNYTVPFAVYNEGNGRYDTYSPADDDYALIPFQALFVQRPNNVTSFDAPADGRQLTSEITSQNARKRSADGRKLFDIQVSDGEFLDKTRLVVNADAALDYEIGRDASKFFADGTSTPQIYSIGSDDTQYAINERPEGDGTLRIGIIFAADGEYTLSAVRNSLGKVILKDHFTGEETNLEQNSYTFEAEAGMCNARFTIRYAAGTTGIQAVDNGMSADKEVYTLDGIRMGNTTEGLQKGVYVVRQGQKTQKVIVK